MLIDVSLTNMEKRAYQQTARASTAEQTGMRTLDAMMERYRRLSYDQIRLKDVAADAGVTEQTVIRRFGTKAALTVAMVERELGQIVKSRSLADTSDPARVIADLVRHYEVYGALILKVYAEAGMVEGLAPLVAAGRAYHLGWCDQTFTPHLDHRAGKATRARRLAQVTAICDATTWRILREDAGLSSRQVTVALRELVTPLLATADDA